jgi:hypothetical protein
VTVRLQIQMKCAKIPDWPMWPEELSRPQQTYFVNIVINRTDGKEPSDFLSRDPPAICKAILRIRRTEILCREFTLRAAA